MKARVKKSVIKFESYHVFFCFILKNNFNCLMQVIQLIRDDILPNSAKLPRDFIAKVMQILNRGSIHSVTASSFIGLYIRCIIFSYIIVSTC
jgi:hypothetical protein